jgi:hypothetical protein
MPKAKVKKEVVETEPVITAEAVEQAVNSLKNTVGADFKVKKAVEDEAELLQTRAFNAAGPTTSVEHPETLARIEIWTDKPRFFLKRLPAGCFFNPWDYQKGGKDDIRYSDVYGRKAKWVQVSAQIFQLYERFVLGEEDEGKLVHNNLLLVQADQLYKNSLN